jgi:hypothetical protein
MGELWFFNLFDSCPEGLFAGCLLGIANALGPMKSLDCPLSGAIGRLPKTRSRPLGFQIKRELINYHRDVDRFFVT